MQRQLKCFLSASDYANTSKVRIELQQQNVEVYDIYSSPADSSITDPIITKIKRADFVVIIIEQEEPEPYYHLGLSNALNKPALILIHKELSIPHFIQDYQYYVTDFRETDLSYAVISQFVKDIRSNKYKSTKRSTNSNFRRIGSDKAHSYLQQIQALRVGGSGFQLENIIYQFIQDLGIRSIISEPALRHKGVGIALWNESLSTTVGNPLLIEVKYGSLSSRSIEEAEQQLSEYIHKGDAKLGVLLYLDRNNRRFSNAPVTSPFIIRYEIEDFIKDVMNSSFEEVILKGRNRNIHGI